MSGATIPKAWGSYPVRWLDGHSIMALPEHIDLSTIDLIREQLLSIINRDVPVLVADMTETISCDHTGSDATVHHHNSVERDDRREPDAAVSCRRFLFGRDNPGHHDIRDMGFQQYCDCANQ